MKISSNEERIIFCTCYGATANTVEETKKLIETGFKYVCTRNDIMLFRKQK
ncbi:MAG: hypothetical protein PVH12_07470 [Candidatus Bathyarchaeota archaeon]|jgi:hypothetical protein